jgi:hypothetical protein
MSPGARAGVLALACCALGMAQAPVGAPPADRKAVPIVLVNPGFESTRPGMLGNPEGWFSIQHAGDLSYTFKLDTTTRHDGERSLRIDNVGPEPFGSIYQQVPALAHRGKRLRFSAWLRTEDARGSATGGGAVLMMQAMQAGAPLAWNHMKDAPVRGSTDWHRYQLELDVPAAADQVEVGAMLHGPGRLWIDDASLEDLP